MRRDHADLRHNYIVKDVNRLASVLRRNGLQKSQPVVDRRVSIFQRRPAGGMRIRTYRSAVEPNEYRNAKEAFAQAVKLISECKRPFIYGGTVGFNASKKNCWHWRKKSTRQLAAMGAVGVSHDHPRFLGADGMHGNSPPAECLSEADLLIAIGTRFSDRATATRWNTSREESHPYRHRPLQNQQEHPGIRVADRRCASRC